MTFTPSPAQQHAASHRGGHLQVVAFAFPERFADDQLRRSAEGQAKARQGGWR